MARNDRTTAGPFWTRNWIEKMWRFTAENFVDFDTGSVDFEALGREEYEFRKALFYRKFKNSPRAKEAFEESNALYMVNVERGKKGGRPRKNISDGDAATSDGAEESTTISNISGTPEALVNQPRGEADSLRGECHSAPPRTLPLPTWKEFTLFVDGDGLDYTDAREWWEMTMVDRAGNDRYGNPITNWKVACRRFCKAKANKRTPNGETT